MTEAEKAYQYFVIAVPENEEQAKAYFWARKALQSTLTQPNEWVSVEERLDGVLQALRAGKSLGKEKPQRCDRGLERHDFGEKEGANQWMRSNAPC